MEGRRKVKIDFKALSGTRKKRPPGTARAAYEQALQLVESGATGTLKEACRRIGGLQPRNASSHKVRSTHCAARTRRD